MGAGNTKSTSRSGFSERIPMWVYSAVVPPECAGDSFGGYSDGFQIVGGNVVNRHRSGQFDADGAKWSRGFTSGKHVFEVHYPVEHRGASATIGVCLDGAPLHAKGRVPLCGANNASWGVDLRTRRAVHKNVIVKKYPQFQAEIPDKFFLYFDADSRAVQLGSEIEYYGTAHVNIPSNGKPLYPMVSATLTGAMITMIYRGQGDINRGPVLNGPPLGPPLNLTTVTTETTTAAAPPPPPPQQEAPPPPPPEQQAPPPSAPEQEAEATAPEEEKKAEEAT